MTCLHLGVSELVQLKKLCSTHNSGGIGRRKFDDGGRSSGSSSSEPNLGKRLIQFYILDSRIIEMSYIYRYDLLRQCLGHNDCADQYLGRAKLLSVEECTLMQAHAIRTLQAILRTALSR